MVAVVVGLRSESASAVVGLGVVVVTLVVMSHREGVDVGQVAGVEEEGME